MPVGLLPRDCRVRSRFSGPGLCLRAAAAIFARVASVARQILALAGALLAQPRVEADQEAFAGELGAEDFSHRVGDQCLGTQGRPGRITPGGLQQFAEVDRAQGRDPVQADR